MIDITRKTAIFVLALQAATLSLSVHSTETQTNSGGILLLPSPAKTSVPADPALASVPSVSIEQESSSGAETASIPSTSSVPSTSSMPSALSTRDATMISAPVSTAQSVSDGNAVRSASSSSALSEAAHAIPTTANVPIPALPEAQADSTSTPKAAVAQSGISETVEAINASEKTSPGKESGVPDPQKSENAQEQALNEQKAAEKSAAIQKLLHEAEIYLYGDQVPVDLTKAAALYAQAAELGSPKAMMRLATLYRKGTGVEKSLQKSFELVKKAAELDYVPAYAVLGFSYKDGIGVMKNPASAEEWLEKAAEKGHALARVIIAEKYLGQDSEDAKAKGRSYNEALLENASPQELYTVSYAYGHGLRLPKDVNKAVFWGKAAAEKGGVNAMFYVGECYWNKQDFGEALKWFEKAAEKGLGAAELQTGRLYRDGAQGVDPDPVKAVYWLKRSVPYALPEDLLTIVTLLQTGPSSVKDRREADRYLDLYIKKTNVKDIQNQADRYWNGIGVRKNFDLGGALSLAALQKGDRSEVCEFAMRLAQPNWVKRDAVTAYAILNQCILEKNPSEEIKQAFRQLEEKMSAQEIRKAQETDGNEALNNYLNTHKPQLD